MWRRLFSSLGALICAVVFSSPRDIRIEGHLREQLSRAPQEASRFRTVVELIRVTVTVTDQNGRFVRGLRKEDFRVFEDGKPTEITQFTSERVPVSVGVALDASGSMAGEKWKSAVNALERFLNLLQVGDEVFLYRFSSHSELVQQWTTSYMVVEQALERIQPDGGTALLDAIADAVRLTQTGRHRRKTVLVISDGNDTASEIGSIELRQLIRESDVMVYAIGIGEGAQAMRSDSARVFPPPLTSSPPVRNPAWPQTATREDADIGLLREITDDSGGRTEVVPSLRQLKPTIADIAEELRQQYLLGYLGAAHRDGRWHAIRVETGDAELRVRARRGYTATP